MFPAKDASHGVQSHGLNGGQGTQINVLEQSCLNLSFLTLTLLFYLFFADFSLAKKLNERNIVNVLQGAKFSAGHWEQLGQQLIDHTFLTTVRANRHGDSSLCMSDTISCWLRTDTEASWEKLAAAAAKVKGYGEATAASVLQKAGIVHTRMLTVF